MANVKKKTKEVIQLELTPSEAKALFVTARLVSGSTDTSINKFINRIYMGLRDCGLTSERSVQGLLHSYYSNHFRDGSLEELDEYVTIEGE